VVEDNAVNVKVLRRMLEQRGFEVTVAVNGREAVERAAEQRFAAILMDIEMPEMDGYEATERIRQRERDLHLPPVPIIGLSGYASSEHRARGLAAGMNEFETKPFDRERLFALLATFVPE